jgi:hypothetical protein
MSKHYSKGSNSHKYYKPSNTFEGSNKEMKGSYYTYNPEQQAVDQYQQTTEKLVEVVCSSFKEAQLLKACIKDLKKQTHTEPTLQNSGTESKDPQPTKQDELKYGLQFKDWQYKDNSLNESLNKTFTIIHGQCNRAMKAKIEEDANWETIDKNCDPIGLLKIIKAIAHNNESQRNPTVSLILAEQRLMSMKQGDGESNDAYRLKFENQANVIENMGGQLYRDSTLNIVSQQKYSKDYSKLDSSERTQSREAATDLWKATLLITNSNPNKFDQLKKEMHNNLISGDTASYPSTFNGAYTRLNQYKSYGQTTVTDSQGTSFAQKGRHDGTRGNDSGRDDDSIKEAPPRFADWKCSVCGEIGHAPNPRWCSMVKALSNSQTVRNKLKAAIDSDNNSDSASSDNKSRKQKFKSTKKKGKPSPKKSEQRRKEDKELIQSVLATVGRQEHSSDSSSNGTEESDTEHNSHFQMFETGFQMHQTNILDKSDDDDSGSSVETYLSSQKERSVLTQQSWTLISKKPKRYKHKSTDEIHRGDTIVMKNNLTGTVRLFTSDKRINNSFSALDDDTGTGTQY